MTFEKNDIFLDLEVIPGCDWYMEEQATKVSAPANYVNPDAIEKWMVMQGNGKKEQARHATGLIPIYGQIICIGFAVNDGPVMTLYGTDEKDLIKRFYQELSDRKVQRHRWVGHNVVGFDLPYLWTRSVVHHLDSAFLPDKQIKPWEMDKAFDTLYQLAGKDFKGHSLGNVCKVFGIPDNYPDVDGSMIWDMYREGLAESIQQYCANDVCMTRQLFNRIEGYL